MNKDIPQYSLHIQSDDKGNYLCSCSGPSKPIDRSGCHLTSCKIGGGAIRLHNYVAQALVLFFLYVAYEQTNIFAEIRRPNG